MSEFTQDRRRDDEQKKEDAVKFLHDNGHIVLMMANTLSLQCALCEIMNDSQLRAKVCNYFQIDNLYDVHFYYFLMDSEEKEKILEGIKKNFRVETAIQV